MIEENNIEFTFNDFNDYAKELADIKATYDELIKDEEIQKILRLKKRQEVINKAIDILEDNFVYDYVRSCDTSDGIGYDSIDTEHFTYKVYEMLKEVSK